MRKKVFTRLFLIEYADRLMRINIFLFLIVICTPNILSAQKLRFNSYTVDSFEVQGLRPLKYYTISVLSNLCVNRDVQVPFYEFSKTVKQNGDTIILDYQCENVTHGRFAYFTNISQEECSHLREFYPQDSLYFRIIHLRKGCRYTLKTKVIVPDTAPLRIVIWFSFYHNLSEQLIKELFFCNSDNCSIYHENMITFRSDFDWNGSILSFLKVERIR